MASGNGRHAVLMAIFLVTFLLLAVRLVWIQVVEAPVYAAKATSQRMRDIELSPRRGTIYDREGEPLAVSVSRGGQQVVLTLDGAENLDDRGERPHA